MTIGFLLSLVSYEDAVKQSTAEQGDGNHITRTGSRMFFSVC